MKLLQIIISLNLLLSLISIQAFSVVTPKGSLVEKYEITVKVDKLLSINEKFTEKYEFTFQDRKYVGYPGVFSPEVFPSTGATKELPIVQGESFLEIGPGTGIFSIQAALLGASSVVAIDINPDAVKNTEENAKIHGVVDKIQVFEGDLFFPLTDHDKFDTIFWSVPFCHRAKEPKKMSFLELSVYDPFHESLRRFLEHGKTYLKPGGRILLTYSTSHGDIEFLQTYADEYHWNVSLFKKEENEYISVELYELKPLQ